MKKIVIRQIDMEVARNKAFMPYSYILQHYGAVCLSDYKIVYESEREDGYDYEDAFYEFNVQHPKDFRGHSMSVSDVLTLGDDTVFCDSIRWVKVPNIGVL